MKLYHYSNTKIDEIDMSKCDGFWMTTIEPTADEEMLFEIGADLKYCHVVEFDDSGEYVINADNFNVAEILKSENADYIENRYDGFTDYATTNANLIKIIEVIKL